jgi:enoyl-CoA hydratase/carnithine racemase
MNFIKIGLIPDGGAHFFLEKILGEAKAKQIIWRGETMTAQEAMNLGIVNEVVEKDLHTALDRKLNEWEHEPIQAMIKTKKIYAENNRPVLLKLLELEKQGQYKMRETLDHKEGIEAFLEKRPPRFIGK